MPAYGVGHNSGVAPRGRDRVDGRRRRGAASRDGILDAACELVTSEGVGSLTHRSVASTAGMSAARVAYHFPTVEDLLAAVAEEYLARFDRDLRARAAEALLGTRSIVEICTTLLHELVTDRSAEFLSMVEIRLALSRRGRQVRDPGIVALVQSFGVSSGEARSISAAMFGFAVLAAADDEPVHRGEVEAHVRLVLGAPR